MRGHTLIELLVVMLVLGTVAAFTVPHVGAALDGAKVRGAAFYVSSRFALARTLAAHRNANVAFRFEAVEGGVQVRVFADGNGNGVRTAEITRGIDTEIMAFERLDHSFPGVRYGFISGAKLIDGTAVAESDDPIRFGSTDMLIFSPSGTATSGTVYIRGRDNWQYAVVVLGATGRTRIARFNLATRRWEGP